VSDDSRDSEERKSNMSSSKRTSRRGRDSAPDAAFDAWLDRGLNSMFGKVAEEPVPPDLLALIEKHRKEL
jgi:hypothetical protein